MKFANAHGTIGTGMLLGKQTFFPDASLGGGLKDYAFYTSPAFKDLISGQPLQTTLDAGRPLPDNSGNVAGLNEPVLGANGIYSYGPYTNLLKWSEKIDGTNWHIRGTATLDGSSYEAPNGTNTASQISGIGVITNDVYQYCGGGTVANGTVTPFVWLKRISTAGILSINSPYGTSFGTWHIDLSLLPDEWVYVTKDLTAVTEINSWVLTDQKQGGIMFKNISGQGLITCQLWGAQLTESPYALPYIKTEDSQVSVPINYSDANGGYKWPINSVDTPLLLNALDGKADGSELVQNGDFSNWTGNELDIWEKYSATTATVTEDPNGVKFATDATDIFVGVQQDILTIGTTYEVVFEVYSSDTNRIQIQAGEAISEHFSIGIHTIRITCTNNTKLKIRIDEDANKTCIIRNVSVKQISPAQGEMQVEWIPEFNTADISGVINILTAKDEAISFLEYDADNSQLKLSDGVNTATVAYTAVSGAKATIKAAYGTHPTAGANKMQLIVNSTESAVADFAGSFPNSDKLAAGWSNEYYQAIKSIKFYKEPKHWS